MVTFGYSPITIPQKDLKEVGDVLGTHEMIFQGYTLGRQNIYYTLYEMQSSNTVYFMKSSF